MPTRKIQLDFKEPVFWFCIGWSLILLAPILPILANMQTFIHPWRPELTASILFLATLGYLAYNFREKLQLFRLSRQEFYFLVLPLSAFIAWSGLSVFWAPSWKSALYHTLVWAEYLIFYLIARRILEYKKGLQTFLIPLSASILILTLPTVFEYFSFLIFGGATSLGTRYAKYGELINTIFPILLVVVLRLEGKKFAGGLLFIVALWLFIIGTLGRTNLLLFAAGLATVTATIFIFRRFHKYRLKIALIAAAAVLLPAAFHSLTFFNEEPNVPLVKRVGDENAISYSTDVRRFLKSVSLEMFYRNPLTGVGGNNYGQQFNRYRELYAERNPGDINLMTAEAEIAERSHNEYLQILSELGAIGGAIFFWFLCGIGLLWLTLLKRIRSFSLLQLAALLGITFFLASSFVSSFSFRLVQNGFVFFFVLAIAAKSLLKPRKSPETVSTIAVSPKFLRVGIASGAAACFLMISFCLLRVGAAYYSYQAQMETEIEKAEPLYQMAFRLDGENPNACYALGMDSFYAGDYQRATIYLRKAIDNQRATSIEYSYLATAQTLAGNSLAAEETFAEALRLYPYSTFVRTRYAALLKENGKSDEADFQLKSALRINKPEANTWWTLLNEGARQASLRAANNRDFVTVMKLNPEKAIYAVVAEREIRHPEEKFEIKLDGD